MLQKGTMVDGIKNCGKIEMDQNGHAPPIRIFSLVINQGSFVADWNGSQ